ncbi:MAG: hypothetical protein ACI8V2_002595 [Candidatus Latescibacterota bacterium]|jgi:hypothetical protein
MGMGEDKTDLLFVFFSFLLFLVYPIITLDGLLSDFIGGYIYGCDGSHSFATLNF